MKNTLRNSSLLGKTLIALTFGISIFISSCEKNETPPEVGEFENAVFIVNEGNFTAGNASLTYYNNKTKKIEPQVFYRKNNAPLGDVANSISLDENSIYVVVNNSHVIYKINSEDGIYQAKTAQLTSPRQFLKINDQRALISDLYENNLTVVNPENMEVISKIPLGRTSENLLKVNNEVFITNWSAYNQDKVNNMLLVLNTSNMEITDSIQVGLEPNSIVLDKENNLWVLCSGGFMNDELPSLWKINSTTHETLKKYDFSDITTSPTKLNINKTSDTLYFLNKCVYRMAINENSIPNDCFISPQEDVNFYSLAVSPLSEIYVTDANDYNRNGDVYRFSPKGILIEKFEAGIIPGAIGFLN